MAIDGIDRLHRVRREAGKEPVSKHQPIRFSLGMENERADAERDGRAYLARRNSRARMGTGNTHVLLPKDVNFLPALPVICMAITYSRVWINRVRLPILLVVS